MATRHWLVGAGQASLDTRPRKIFLRIRAALRAVVSEGASQQDRPRPHLLRYFCAVRRGVSWDCPAGHYPLHRLAGDTRDQIEVTVVMEHRDAFPLRHGSDQQSREANRSDLPAAPQRGLHAQGTTPVLIVSGQPFVPSVPVGSQLIELLAAPGCDRVRRQCCAGGDAPGGWWPRPRLPRRRPV